MLERILGMGKNDFTPYGAGAGLDEIAAHHVLIDGTRKGFSQQSNLIDFYRMCPYSQARQKVRATVQQSLHDHILFLEQKVQQLSTMLTLPRLAPVERDHIAREIQLANTALSHYRRAFEIEQKLKSSSPS